MIGKKGREEEDGRRSRRERCGEREKRSSRRGEVARGLEGFGGDVGVVGGDGGGDVADDAVEDGPLFGIVVA
eukprot:CAMPEP_0197417470 /NCGR_PEP_ID=MMETSP1170-20131217/3498_1 /TAXON_ID=54406 /ORGANISM="Sarcinochrysis sp, Strain CCMP770" /LENGTH=71 /DNA_ID=CAMNT_0042944439 /DNA_START=122 /DNA_END=333 /DNA_ORIENTATION=+